MFQIIFNKHSKYYNRKSEKHCNDYKKVIFTMSLLNTLPLDLSDKIYKMSLQDHFTNFRENWIKFHLTSAKKRNKYDVILYDNMSILKLEIDAIIYRKIYPLQANHVLSLDAFQNKIFWYDALYDLVILNSELIENYNGNYFNSRFVENIKKSKKKMYQTIDFFK